MTAVSVIVPFLDQERYLGEAIESVRAQTMPDWELLLVDDASTDQSPQVAASYAAADPRIRLLRHPDGGTRGAAAARNLAIAHATGEFVSFLDGDDVYEPHKLESEVRLLRSMPEAAMLYAPTIWWYPGGERRDKIDKLGVSPGEIYRPPVLAADILLRHRGDVPCICSALIRRSALGEVGGFEESFRLYEDQTLWGKLFLRYSVLVSARPASRYRQHAASTSARAQCGGEYHPWRRHAAERRFLEWLQSYSTSLGNVDPDVSKALREASSSYRQPIAATRRFLRYVGFTAKDETRRHLGALVRRLLPR
jgi:glycosyltransferase involved in cell wall biosynthesis